MISTVETARRYSRTSSNILLIGQSGTGKEMFAQSIHNDSQRRRMPFVAVNCAAIPEQLLESELFGYAPGAFTGAHRDGKAGLFELAHKGTLFLDEIGEISLTLQAKLLRVLQEREIMRVGEILSFPWISASWRQPTRIWSSWRLSVSFGRIYCTAWMCCGSIFPL